MMEQAKFYGERRTNYYYNGVNYSQPSQPIVTNAKPGTSIQNYGLAIDFAIINDHKEIVWDTTTDFNKDGVVDWLEVIAEAKKVKV